MLDSSNVIDFQLGQIMWKGKKNVHNCSKYCAEKDVSIQHLQSLGCSSDFAVQSKHPFIHLPVRHNQLIIYVFASPFISPADSDCLRFSHIPSFTHLSILIRGFIFRLTDSYPSLGSWARWRCWRSVQSWWRGWWSPGPSAQRGPTRCGYVKTGRGPRCWWTTCCPATTMATSSSPRSGKDWGI